ncbi:MAG: D-tyrosyl-tRNA(Tyr) deacylase [Acidobacteria bacterium]|nr:D-tyrosyl-tRNA(Tyr) deacylase [Acidobacteriota bacterium]
MRAVIQRVLRASVAVDGDVVGAIGHGLLAFVGVAAGDGPADLEYTASKIAEMRIFHDADGRMNRSVRDVNGAVLLVSQFTLLGDVRKGRRPAFDDAEAPERALEVYEALSGRLRELGLRVETGRFRAEMTIDLVNHGPVTILLDSRRRF